MRTAPPDLWVDFNDVERGVVTTLVKFANVPLFVGKFVTVGDDDGNTSRGEIADIDAIGIVTVHLHGTLKPQRS